VARQVVVELGDHRYTVVPQRIGKITHQLGDALALLAGDEDQAGGIVEQLGGQAHSVLSVFIAGLMPRHEFLGFGSAQALADDAYDDAQDRSPDFDQIVETFQAVMKVNRLDLVKHLEKLVGADFFQAAARKVIADALTGEEGEAASTSTGSQSSSPAATPPTTSTPSLTILRTEDLPGNEYETILDDPAAGNDMSPPDLRASEG
jgi:hypothetical protein